MKKLLILGIALATAGIAQAAVPNSLLYHGRLAKEGEKLGGRVLMMTFSIYDGKEVTTPVWTLTDSFRLSANGEFTAELKDEKLADALASVKGEAYIALTPAGGTEFPRQKLELYPRAARAAREVGRYRESEAERLCEEGDFKLGWRRVGYRPRRRRGDFTAKMHALGQQGTYARRLG